MGSSPTQLAVHTRTVFEGRPGVKEVVNQSWEGLKLNQGIRYGKVLEGLDFGRIWLHALDSEHCTLKAI